VSPSATLFSLRCSSFFGVHHTAWKNLPSGRERARHPTGLKCSPFPLFLALLLALLQKSTSHFWPGPDEFQAPFLVWLLDLHCAPAGGLKWIGWVKNDSIYIVLFSWNIISMIHNNFDFDLTHIQCDPYY